VRTILVAGIILPTIVLLVVFGVTITTLRALGTPPIAAENVVHVQGNQWWWRVGYPAWQFETANEIHIPVGEPVQIVLESSDVIHSFWVPELHGKLDMIPGRTNQFWIQADEAGIYDGVCAEFCGGPHALMRFVVVAQPAEEYAAWIAAQQQPARLPSSDLAQEGLEVFLRKDCGDCHTIRGTQATGVLGPDLTHFASRQLLAAGAAPNNRGSLGGWILDPQHIKSGAFMPPTPFTGDELTALLTWMETLE
jgi:cytochrome c oxidase subunit 2